MPGLKKGLPRTRALMILVLSALLKTAFAQPYHIHLSWQHDTKTTVTVSFRSLSSDGRVEYGLSPSYGSIKSQTGTAYAGSYIHHIELTGLLAGTLYHYRCGDSVNGWSQDYTFKTSSTPDTPFLFGVAGDSQERTNVRRAVKNNLKTYSPDFSILAGDAVTTGPDQLQWDVWFTIMQDLIARSPRMQCLGNHEDNAQQYFDQFSFPVNGAESGNNAEAYYSFNYNNAHFICLSTEMDQAGLQRAWLQNDLSAASSDPSILWKFVYYHRPVYTWASGHEPNTNGRTAWVPLFEQYRVDMVFSGHCHVFEESHPIKAGVRSTEAAGGVRYITTGGSGGTLCSSGSTNSLLAYTKAVYHHCLLRINGSRLDFEAKYTNGLSFRSFSVQKQDPPRLSGVRTIPAEPVQGSRIFIYADVSDFDGIQKVVITHRQNNGAFIQEDMAPDTGNTWVYDLGYPPKGAVVEYYFTAFDKTGTSALFDNNGAYYGFTLSVAGRLATEAFSFVSVSPGKVFVPSGSVPGNEFRLYFSHPEILQSVCRIYSARGRLVRELPLNRENLTSGYFSWDGRDRDCLTVPSGLYVYQIECRNETINGSVVVAR